MSLKEPHLACQVETGMFVKLYNSPRGRLIKRFIRGLLNLINVSRYDQMQDDLVFLGKNDISSNM